MNICVFNTYMLLFDFSVIRLIQQYLKESNLVKTLQTLQVSIYRCYTIYSLANGSYQRILLINVHNKSKIVCL